MKSYIKLGNSYELIKDIPSKSIDCIYTDVPYLYIKGGESKSELGQRMDKRNETLKNLEITNGFDYIILDDFVRVMKKVNIMIWVSKLQILDVMNYFMNLDKEIYFEMIVWGKTNPPPMTNNTWLSDLEYCLHFREKGVKLNDGYDLKSKFHISGLNVDDKNLYEHPTIKPLEMTKQHILHITQENDIVFDMFLGSGTTAVACKETNRRYIGFEINKHYFNIAKNRLNGITQLDVKEKESGILNIFDFMGD